MKRVAYVLAALAGCILVLSLFLRIRARCTVGSAVAIIEAADFRLLVRFTEDSMGPRMLWFFPLVEICDPSMRLWVGLKPKPIENSPSPVPATVTCIVNEGLSVSLEEMELIESGEKVVTPDHYFDSVVPELNADVEFVLRVVLDGRESEVAVKLDATHDCDWSVVTAGS